MDSDIELILSALQDSSPKFLRKRKVLQEFGDFGLCDGGVDKKDAISKLSDQARRKERSEKRKQLPVEGWNNKDFLTYTQDLLKPYRVHLENDGINGMNLMARMYDKLASHFCDAMCNRVLKEYLQWWVLSFGSGISSHSVYVQAIYDEKYVVMFVRRYNEVVTGPKEGSARAVERDDATIFSTGGLPMLLMSKGIVVTHSFLRNRKEESPFTKIGKVLRTFSANVLKNTMDITINGAPYLAPHKVDFISIARPALELHSLKKYLNLDYAKFFQGDL